MYLTQGPTLEEQSNGAPANVDLVYGFACKVEGLVRNSRLGRQVMLVVVSTSHDRLGWPEAHSQGLSLLQSLGCLLGQEGKG